MKRVLVPLAVLLLVAFGLNAMALDPANQSLAVKDQKGGYVGTVNRIVLDPLGNIAFVILYLSEAKGGREIIVPLPFFSKNEMGEIILNLGEKEIAAAPEFDMSNLNDIAYAERVYKFYGLAPPWSEGMTDQQ